MIRPRVILGPPGCGKTHRLLDLLCGELAGGTPPQRIAFVTFTRAARREALERIKARLGLGEEDMPWVRTIHSTAYRLLELAPGQLMDEELWGAFARRYGYRLSDCVLDLESPFEPPLQQTPEDRARYVHDWGRNCRLDPERALRRCPVEGVKATLYRQFVRRVEGFKREEGLLDFSDLLDQVLARGLRPPVEVLFVDEAQDLSPLQIAVCEQWFAGVQRVYLAGDDDQAIYTFQGADPTWLGELARRGTMEVLEQSHRVPKQPHALAQKVITRNEIRVPKSYEPRPAAGSILRLDTQAALKLLDESKDTFILARNRIFLRPIARELLHRGIAYVVEGRGGPSPLSNRRIVKAINAGSRIASGDIRVGDLHDLLVLVPSGGPLLPGASRRGSKRLLIVGSGSRVTGYARNSGSGSCSRCLSKVGRSRSCRALMARRGDT